MAQHNTSLSFPEIPDLPERAPIAPLPAIEAPVIPPLPRVTAPPALSPEQTVEGRTVALTTTENPLLTSAQTAARQRAAGRGLISSTLAEQAGTQAVIETATPIARADAAASQRQLEQTTEAQRRREERQFELQAQADTTTRAEQLRREEIMFSSETERERAIADDKIRRDELAFAAAEKAFQDNVDKREARNVADTSRLEGAKTAYSTTLVGIQDRFDREQTAIANAPDGQFATPNDRIRALNDLATRRGAAIEVLNNLYSPDVYDGWSEDWELIPDIQLTPLQDRFEGLTDTQRENLKDVSDEGIAEFKSLSPEQLEQLRRISDVVDKGAKLSGGDAEFNRLFGLYRTSIGK